MKIKLFLYLFIAIVAKVYGQESFKIDFRNKAITSSTVPVLTNHKYTQIKISNINPYLYKVKILSKDSVLSESNDVPALWTYLSTFDNIQKFADEFSKLLNKPSSTPQNENIDKSPNIDFDQETIKTATMAVTQKSKNRLVIAFDTVFSDMNKLEDYLVDSVYTHINNLTYQLGNLNSLKNLEYYDSSVVNSLINERVHAINTFKHIAKNNLSLKKRLADNIKKFETFLANNSDTITKLSLENLKTICANKYNNIGELTANIDTLFSASRYEDLVSSTINLNTNNFIYTSLPIYAGSDITKINIQIEPRNESKNVTSNSYYTQLILEDDRKCDIGFSTGFYYSGLYNRKYYNNLEVSSTGDSTNYAVESNASLGEIGINALLHAHYRVNKNFGIGISGGPGVVIDEKILPRLFLGLSAAFGDKNKFVITIGGVTGKVDYLSEQYKDGNKKPIVDFTTSQYKFALFGSIGYTLFTTKSKE